MSAVASKHCGFENMTLCLTEHPTSLRAAGHEFPQPGSPRRCRGVLECRWSGPASTRAAGCNSCTACGICCTRLPVRSIRRRMCSIRRTFAIVSSGRKTGPRHANGTCVHSESERRSVANGFQPAAKPIRTNATGSEGQFWTLHNLLEHHDNFKYRSLAERQTGDIVMCPNFSGRIS